MPIKKVRELKDKTDRAAGMEWARALNIPDLKTDEWEYAAMLASEGLDVRQLDTLIMATPRSNITQSCGRIMREENNRERLIYDILDFEIYENGFYQRKKYYKQITNTIEEINF